MNVYDLGMSRVKGAENFHRPREPQDLTSDEDEIVYYAHDHRSDTEAASYQCSSDQQRLGLVGSNEAVCAHPDNIPKRKESSAMPVSIFSMTDDVEVFEPQSMASVQLGVGTLLEPFKETETIEPCGSFDFSGTIERTPIQPFIAIAETVNREAPAKSHYELSSDNISDSENERDNTSFIADPVKPIDKSEFVKSVIEEHESAVDGFSTELHLVETYRKAMNEGPNGYGVDPIVSSRNSNPGSQESHPEQILSYSRTSGAEKGKGTNWVEAILEEGLSLEASKKPVYRNSETFDRLPVQTLALLYQNQKTHIERLNFLKLHPDSLMVLEIYSFCNTQGGSVPIQRAGGDSSPVVLQKELLLKEDIKQSIFWDAGKLFRGTSDSEFAIRVMLMSHCESHFRGLAILHNVGSSQPYLPCIVDGIVENSFFCNEKGIEEFEFVALLGPMILEPIQEGQSHMKSCCSSQISHCQGEGLIPVTSDFYDFFASLDLSDRAIRILARGARPWVVSKVKSTISPRKESDRTHITQWRSSGWQ